MTIYSKEMVSVAQRDISSAVVIAAQRTSAKMRKLKSIEMNAKEVITQRNTHYITIQSAGIRKLYHLQQRELT